MLLKLVYLKQIHLYNGLINYSQLKKYCLSIFNNLPQQFNFVYMDDQQDQIYITSDADNKSMQGYLQGINLVIVRLDVRQKETEWQPIQQHNRQHIEQSNLQYQNVANVSFQFQPLTSESDVSQITQQLVNDFGQSDQQHGDRSFYSQVESIISNNQDQKIQQLNNDYEHIQQNQRISTQQEVLKIQNIVNNFLFQLNEKALESVAKRPLQVPLYQKISVNSQSQQQSCSLSLYEQTCTYQQSVSTQQQSFQKQESLESLVTRKFQQMLPDLMLKIDRVVESRVNQKINQVFNQYI